MHFTWSTNRISGRIFLLALLAQTTGASLVASEIAVVEQATPKSGQFEQFSGKWDGEQYFVTINGVPDISGNDSGLSVILVSHCNVCNSRRSTLFAESLSSHVSISANKGDLVVNTDGTTSKGNGKIMVLGHTSFIRARDTNLGKCSFWTIVSIGNFGSGDALVSDRSIFQTNKTKFVREYPQGIAFFSRRGETTLLVNE